MSKKPWRYIDLISPGARAAFVMGNSCKYRIGQMSEIKKAPAPTAAVERGGVMEWHDIKTAPYQKVIEVKNDIMDNPVLATRGYMSAVGVHPDSTLFTSVYTPDKYFPFPAGKLVRPTHWRLLTTPEPIAREKGES